MRKHHLFIECIFMYSSYIITICVLNRRNKVITKQKHHNKDMFFLNVKLKISHVPGASVSHNPCIRWRLNHSRTDSAYIQNPSSSLGLQHRCLSRVYSLCLQLSLQWRHNERNGVSNDRRLVCLLNRMFRRISKKISKAFVLGIHRWPHKGPVAREIFSFDDRHHGPTGTRQSTYTVPTTKLDMSSHIAKFMGSTWGPPGSCRPQMGPMLAPWTLLSGLCRFLWLS